MQKGRKKEGKFAEKNGIQKRENEKKNRGKRKIFTLKHSAILGVTLSLSRTRGPDVPLSLLQQPSFSHPFPS